MLGDWPWVESTFKYQPLDLDRPALRLLRLKGAHNSQATIDCEIIHAYFDVKNIPDYEAISYTWGPMDTPWKIRLDGSDFFVPANLYSVLWDALLRDKDRILWVDAICINQGDVRERGHQVQQMRHIYERAQSVIFWLGQPTNPSIDILMNLLAKLQRRTRGVSWSLTDPRWRREWEQIPKDSLGNLHSAFKEILQLPWFRRVWILQEVANARAGLVYCSHKSISAKIFAVCPRLLDEFEPNPHCQAVLDVMPGPSRSESWWFQDRRLYTLLKKFSETEATRDHDRIFALLGLCPEANAQITVDYNKPMPQLLRETASYILKDNASPYDIDSLQGLRYDSTEKFLKDIDALHSRVLEQLLQVEPDHVVDDFVIRFQDQLAITPELCVAAMTKVKLGDKFILSIFHRNPRTLQIEDRRGRTPLSLAAEYKNEVFMKLLIEHGADCKDHKGFIPLYKASELGNEAIVQLLLDRDASSTNGTLRSAYSPLVIACRKGHEAIARKLLHRRQLPFFLDEALMEAILSKRTAITRLLLDHNARATDSTCKTALQIGNKFIIRILLRGTPATKTLKEACKRGDEGVLRLLLDRGAPATDSMLIVACAEGHESIVRLLLDRGAPLTEPMLTRAYDGGHKAIVRLLLEKGVPNTGSILCAACLEEDVATVRLLLDHGTVVKEDALYAACERKYEAIARLLLDYGAVGTTRTLQMACGHGHVPIIRLLLDRGAPLSEYALREACSGGHEAVVRLLLDRDAPSNEFTLRAACEGGHKAIVRLLLDRDTPSNESTLRTACEGGHEAIVRLLLARGTPRTEFALREACEKGRNAIVRLLLGLGAPLESRNYAGQASLLLASQSGHEDVVQTLLDAGADCNSRDTKGRTPLGWALRMQHEGVVQLLRSRGATDEGTPILGGRRRQ